MLKNEDSQAPNKHIAYKQNIRPYHIEIAKLVDKYGAQNASLLDIGAGVGHTLNLIHESSPALKLSAADIDDYLLKKIELTGLTENTYKINDVPDLFELDIHFDIIVMSHVLEHTKRPLDILEGVMKMLNPGGFLILAVPNVVVLNVILGNLIKRHYVNRGHVYAWDRSHWMNFLEEIGGFNVIEYGEDYIHLPIKSNLLMPIQTSLAKVFPWFSYSHFAVLKK